MTMMIVGLGNPGPEYAHTRHNAGFMVVDLLGENLRASYWRDEAGAKTAVVRLGEDELVLVKPQTFVNVSGAAVSKLLDAYEVSDSNDLIVVHDDLDLPPGAVRVKRGGGHGGHNGSAVDQRVTRLGRLCASARGHRASARTHGPG